jgi:hypothetical protein
MSTTKLKLGMPVTITQYFQKNRLIREDINNIPEGAIETEPNKWEFSRYSPVPSMTTGILTGYKQLTTKIHYTVTPKDKLPWDTVTNFYCKEPVYVVQTSLTKKYFVKKEWILGIKEA